MKVAHLNYQGNRGGAGRAVLRIHNSLIDAGVDSRIWTEDRAVGDWRISGPHTKYEKVIVFLRARLNRFYRVLFNSKNPVIHSPALLPSRWVKVINESDVDIVNLHWIGNEMLSVADVVRIKKPTIWTMHDMWGFCGAEHVSSDSRWKIGYLKNNRPQHESGFDINRWTWTRKMALWKKPIHLVTPSSWLSECAHESMIMKNWPSFVIPNPLDASLWQPYDQSLSRKMFNFPDNEILIGFGGGNAHHKGLDLLLEALKLLHCQANVKVRLIVYGQYKEKEQVDFDFPIHYLGLLQDDLSLCVLYNALDILAVPSRNDNLPNTAVEACSCGTPVVAFDIGGLSDIVKHKKTGYLAKPFSAEDLSNGFKWVLAQDKEKIKSRNRSRFLDRFSSTKVASQYIEVYKHVLSLA